MAVDLSIQANSPEPVYEQIVRQIREGVRSGRLKPGAPLPTVRQLATDLVLNRNPVARAYKTLEEQGVIQTAGRKGTFVSSAAVREVARFKSGHAEHAMRRTINTLMGEGLSSKQIAEVFQTALSVEENKELKEDDYHDRLG
jgi:DNA-binding transcriptional regulator YhcF (GntR family)